MVGCGWLKQSHLKLNSSKVEVLCLGLGYPELVCQLWFLDSVTLKTVPAVNSLDVVLDASLSMEAEITNVAILLFPHVCQIKLLLSAHNKLH